MAGSSPGLPDQKERSLPPMPSVARGRPRPTRPLRRRGRPEPPCPRRWSSAAAVCSRWCSTWRGWRWRRSSAAWPGGWGARRRACRWRCWRWRCGTPAGPGGGAAGGGGAAAGDGRPGAELRLPLRRAPPAQGGRAPAAADLVRGDHGGAGGVRRGRLRRAGAPRAPGRGVGPAGAAPPGRAARAGRGRARARARPGGGRRAWPPPSRPPWWSSGPGCPTPRRPASWRWRWAPRGVWPPTPSGPTRGPPGGRARSRRPPRWPGGGA